MEVGLIIFSVFLEFWSHSNKIKILKGRIYRDDEVFVMTVATMENSTESR